VRINRKRRCPVQPKTAIFPGSFDPITNGHLDIIQRASRVFGRVIVAIGHNPEKTEVFTADERIAMIRDLTANAPNVEVEAYEGLTVDFARKVQADVIVRGIRDTIDLRDELQAANTNRLVGDVETVFLMASEQFALTSSTFIKQIVAMGGEESGRLSALVPTEVLNRLRDKVAGA